MKQTVLTLAAVLIALPVFGQDAVKAGDETNPTRRQGARQTQRQETRKSSERPESPQMGREAVGTAPATRETPQAENAPQAPAQGPSQAQSQSNATADTRTNTTVNMTEHTWNGRRWPVERAERRGDGWRFHDRELRRHTDRPRDDWHFKIGRHDRAWYYSRYQNIILIDGCWYYEDRGFFYPAYGFDPDCNYPDNFVVFQF